MLSTAPPTSCGIATFAAALTSGIQHHGAAVRMVEAGDEVASSSLAVCALGTGDRAEIEAAVDVLNDCDAVIVQHEYGIYPGIDGSGVIEVVEAIRSPLIVVAHTVLCEPSDSQRRILVDVCAAADLVVVMTDVARCRLIDYYDVSDRLIRVIPHGAAVPTSGSSRHVSSDGPRILTWGLLGPGKGIEWAIDAIAQVRTTGSPPHYLVAGATHPNVKARDGETYRHSLEQRVELLGLGDRVMFDDTYRTVDGLTELISSADVVVLPYDSAEQVTSGVLVDAVAAGRPVVSTAFPHAIELLASGAGIVVPQRNAVALARAIEHVLNDADAARAMTDEARRLAPSLSWPSVANSYLRAIGELRRARTPVAS